MDEGVAIRVFEALAQETRLRVFRMLVACGPDGMDNGGIAAAAGVSKSAMSRSLAIMAAAGLVRPERQGRRLLYRALPEALQAATEFVAEGAGQAAR